MVRLLSKWPQEANVAQGANSYVRPVFLRLLCACCAALAVSLGIVCNPPEAAASDETTAIAAMTNTVQIGFESADSVVVVNRTDYCGMLSAMCLAGRLQAPILLTDCDSLPDVTSSEIVRLGAKKGYVIGGPWAVGAEVFHQVDVLLASNAVGGQDASSGLTRLFGMDANAQSTACLYETRATAPECIIASKSDYGSAAAIAAYAYAKQVPVLFVDNGERLDKDVLETLQACSCRTVYIIGGTSAVSGTVEAELREQGLACVRMAGSTSFYTAQESNRQWLNNGLDIDGFVAVEDADNLWMNSCLAGVLAGLHNSVVVPASSVAGAAAQMDQAGPFLVHNATGNSKGWAVDSQGNVSAKEIVVEPALPEYVITWKDDDGNVLKTDSVVAGAIPEYSGATPVKAATRQYSYTFAGWSPAIAKATKDATYTAQFKATVNSYTVTFEDGWSGKVLKTQAVEYGKAATAPTAPVHEGYAFEGWDGTFDSVRSDMTITATWKPVKASSGTTSATSGSGTSVVVQPTGWKRLWGKNAYGTMAAIAQRGWSKADTVVIATFNGYWDALSASSLAGTYNAPILLTGRNSLNATTATQIKRLGAKRAFIVGGTAAVSAVVERQVRNLGCTVTRLAGSNAQQTAVQVAKAVGRQSDTCIIATSGGYWDALAASPYAYRFKAPIYLTNSHKLLSNETYAHIKAQGYKRAIIVGGAAAVESGLEQILVDHFNVGFAERVAGDKAVHTSVQFATLAASEGMGLQGMAVATSNGYWDALTGGALCGKNNAVLVLSANRGTLALEPMATFVHYNRAGFSSGYVLGGRAAISDDTKSWIESAHGATGIWDAGKGWEAVSGLRALGMRDSYVAILDRHRYGAAYYLHDIDGNGTPELIVADGTSEADSTWNVYTYQNGSVWLVGTVAAGHTTFGTDAKGNSYLFYGHMGHWALSRVLMDGNDVYVMPLSKGGHTFATYEDYQAALSFHGVSTNIGSTVGNYALVDSVLGTGQSGRLSL